MKRMITIALALMLMTGCTLVRRIQEMSPKHKATWMMNTFVVELQNLRAEARGYYFMDEDSQRIIRYKMWLLRKVFPLISDYADAAEQGKEPDLGLENSIIDVMNLILGAGEAGVPEGAELAEPPPKPRGVILPEDLETEDM